MPCGASKLANVNFKFFTMTTADIIGYLGGIFSSVSFLPQVIKLYKTKSAEDLSMLSLLLLATNVTLWLVYGFLIDSNPIKLTNGIVLSMIAAMVYFKIAYTKKKAL